MSAHKRAAGREERGLYETPYLSIYSVGCRGFIHELRSVRRGGGRSANDTFLLFGNLSALPERTGISRRDREKISGHRGNALPDTRYISPRLAFFTYQQTSCRTVPRRRAAHVYRG